jgi:hypothetical protein
VRIAFHVQLELTDQCRAWQARQLRLRWGFDQPRPLVRAKVIGSIAVASLRCACRCYGKNRRSNKRLPKSRGPGETHSKGKQGPSAGKHATTGSKQNTSGAASGSGKGSTHSGNNVSSSGKGASSSASSSSSSSTPFAGIAAGVAAACSSTTLDSERGKPDNHDIDDNISDDDDITPEEDEYIAALLKSLHEDPQSSPDKESDGSGDEPALPGQKDIGTHILEKMQDEETRFAEHEIADAERSCKAKGTFNEVIEQTFQQGLDTEASAELLLAAARGCEDQPPASSKTDKITLESAELQGPHHPPDHWHKILLSWAEAFRECISSVSSAVRQAESEPTFSISSVALVKISSSSKSLGDTWSYELVHVDQIIDDCLHLRRIGEKGGMLGYLPKASLSKHEKDTVSVLIPNIGVGMVRPKILRPAVPNHIMRVMQLLDMASGPSILSMFASCSICCRYTAAADASNSQGAEEMGLAIPNPIAHCIVVLFHYCFPFSSLLHSLE